MARKRHGTNGPFFSRPPVLLCSNTGAVVSPTRLHAVCYIHPYIPTLKYCGTCAGMGAGGGQACVLFTMTRWRRRDWLSRNASWRSRWPPSLSPWRSPRGTTGMFIHTHMYNMHVCFLPALYQVVQTYIAVTQPPTTETRSCFTISRFVWPVDNAVISHLFVPGTRTQAAVFWRWVGDFVGVERARF